MIKDVLCGKSLPMNDVIPKYHRECQFVILYEKKDVLTKMHLVTFSMEAARKWAFGLQAMLKRKGTFKFIQYFVALDLWLKLFIFICLRKGHKLTDVFKGGSKGLQIAD